jgi:hypothetical protein
MSDRYSNTCCWGTGKIVVTVSLLVGPILLSGLL